MVIRLVDCSLVSLFRREPLVKPHCILLPSFCEPNQKSRFRREEIVPQELGEVKSSRFCHHYQSHISEIVSKKDRKPGKGGVSTDRGGVPVYQV